MAIFNETRLGTPEEASNRIVDSVLGVDELKELYLVSSKNLFNVNSIIVGKFCDEQGNFNDNEIYNISDYIAVEGNTKYVTNKRLRFVTFFDSTKTFVSSMIQTSLGTVVTSPSNASFVIITTYADDDQATIQFEQGEAMTSFLEYGRGYPSNLRELMANKVPINSVSFSSLDFIKIGKNIFNKETGTDYFYVSDTGGILEHETYGYSDFISIDGGVEYTTSQYLRFVAFYTEEYIVMGNNGLGGSYGDSPEWGDTFYTPIGAKYMIVTYRIIEKSELQIEKGSISSEYESYCYNYKDVAIREAVSTSNTTLATIAPTQYVCETKETDFYVENVLRNAKDYLGQTDIDLGLTDSRWKNDSISSTLLDASGLVGTSFEASLDVVNNDFIQVFSKTFQIVTSDMSKTDAVTIGNLGDSFSGRMTWVNNILNEAIPSTNLTFVGVRNANSAPIKCDAQGGYTLTGWFTRDLLNIYNQFVHPINDYLYYGMTSFWIDANSANPSYNAGDFDDAKLLFDSTTGLKLNPNVNDVMNDGTDFITWNGSAWVAVDEATLGGFEFNFAKYRTAWNIPSIDIFSVLLGTNDFAGSSINNFNSTYDVFKEKYEFLISSIHEDLPNCKIIVGVPPSRGKQGKYGTITTEKGKLAMWMCAEKLHTDFADREDENIYILDYHTQVDRVYGYSNTQETPFAEYDGALVDDENLYKTDYIHLGQDGFDQMGLAYMAIIQELR